MNDNNLCSTVGYVCHLLISWSDIDKMVSTLTSIIIMGIVLTNFIISINRKTKDGLTEEEAEEIRKESNTIVNILNKGDKDCDGR